jgi:hypothetical protein
MALSTLDVLDTLEALVAGLTTTQATYVGIPNSIDARLAGIVAVAAPALDDRAYGLIRYTPRFYVGLAYRLAGSTAAQVKTAERALATALDELIAALLADRTLSGTVDDLLLDFSFANNALYQLFVGQEYRIFSISIQVEQQQEQAT